MKKPKKICRVVDLVVYPFSVMVAFGVSDDEMREHLSRYSLPEDDIVPALFGDNVTVKGRTVMFSNNATLIRTRHFPVSVTQYGQLQHEIFHAVCFIMEQVGMPLQVMVSDEAYAYLIQYLTTQIYEMIQE